MKLAASGSRDGQNGEASIGGRLVRAVKGPLALVFLTLIVVFQLACAGFPGFSPPAISGEERAAYDSAMGNLPGNPAAATSALEGFLATWPRSQLADDAAEQLAEIRFAAGDEEGGLRWLGRILSESPNSDRAAPARLRLAQFEYGRDKRSTARRLLEPLRLDRLSLPERRAALRLRVALSQTPVERLGHLVDLRAALADEARERVDDQKIQGRLGDRLAVVDREIAGLIESAAPAELEAMLDDLDGDPPATLVAFELAQRALDAGQLESADRRLDRANRLVRTDDDRARLQVLRERLALLEETADADADLPRLRELVDRPRPRTDGARGKVGVVLPLTGRFGEFGQESLRGLLLATDAFVEVEDPEDAVALPDVSAGRASDFASEIGTAAAGRPEIRLIVRDTGSEPERAAAVVRELAADPEIVAIVGPIFSAESIAAAEAAQSEGIPLITLSHREEVSAGRPEVFRTRTAPTDEVDVVVAHAFEAFSAKRFAVLYPANRYGRGMRQLYWDAVVARGGKMVAASSYDPDSTDFGSAVRDMIGYRFLTDDERKALREREDVLRSARRMEPEEAAKLRSEEYSKLGPEGDPLPPIVDFDVLFIPDAADKIALIAPALAFAEIRGVKLLGTSEWLDDELPRIARHHLTGAVISTAFYPESDVPFVTEFVESYRKTFGGVPGAYAAQAFDAGNLVLVQLASGRDDRRGIRAGLLETRAYPGATGVLTMRPDGNARRRPFLLGVSGRRFQSLD